MKKWIFAAVALCVALLPLAACDLANSGGGYEEPYAEDTQEDGGDTDELAGAEETAGAYREPLTGALITYPERLTDKYEYDSTHGKRMGISDYESDYFVQLQIVVDDIFVNSLDEAYEKLGFGSGFDEAVLLAYTGNYMVLYTDSESFGETTHMYQWLCLLTDGSVLYVSLRTEAEGHASLAQQVGFDFTAGGGELGLAPAGGLAPYAGDSAAAGIWYNADNDFWLDCSGGVLYALYDGGGSVLDCGVYDSFWERLKGLDGERRSVYAADGGLEIDGYDGVFRPADSLGIIPAGISAGIPREGTPAGESSGALSEYRGQWENNAFTCSLDINRGGVIITTGDSFRSQDYTVTEEGYLELSDGALIRPDGSGGLTVDGYEGVFVRKGEAGDVYAPYTGQWHNGSTGDTIWLQDGGGYSYQTADESFGFSGWHTTGAGTLVIANDPAHIDENGNLVIQGYDGVFVREAE